MRLNCSKNNKISIQKHLIRIRNLSMQTPQDVICNYPQIAIYLLNSCGVSNTENISPKIWPQTLMRFFSSSLVGPHKDLLKLFPPFSDFSSTQYFIGSYRIHSVQGIGSDACVYKTVDGYCLKVVGVSKKEKLKKEFEIIKHLHHPNIVECFDFIDDTDYAAIIMEELFPALGAENLYVQALNYCHSQGILHGDIRLNNLGTDQAGNSKLFDFGNSVAIKSPKDKQNEIELLKNIMHSPIAQARIATCRGDVLC